MKPSFFVRVTVLLLSVFTSAGAWATSIENVQWSMFNGQSDVWYDLSGRKLRGKPTAKGIYINSGRKVVLK